MVYKKIAQGRKNETQNHQNINLDLRVSERKHMVTETVEDKVEPKEITKMITDYHNLVCMIDEIPEQQNLMDKIMKKQDIMDYILKKQWESDIRLEELVKSTSNRYSLDMAEKLAAGKLDYYSNPSYYSSSVFSVEQLWVEKVFYNSKIMSIIHHKVKKGGLANGPATEKEMNDIDILIKDFQYLRHVMDKLVKQQKQTAKI